MKGKVVNEIVRNLKKEEEIQSCDGVTGLDHSNPCKHNAFSFGYKKLYIFESQFCKLSDCGGFLHSDIESKKAIGCTKRFLSTLINKQQVLKRDAEQEETHMTHQMSRWGNRRTQSPVMRSTPAAPSARTGRCATFYRWVSASCHHRTCTHNT